MSLFYKKTNNNESRSAKVNELIKRTVSEFICEYLALPITISRVEISKDLSRAKIFFVLPQKHIDSFGVDKFKNTMHDLMSDVLIDSIKDDDNEEVIFLKYLDSVKIKIKSYIAKSLRLRTTPSLFFFIEEDDFYIYGTMK